jgi:hypothetical protein
MLFKPTTNRATPAVRISATKLRKKLRLLQCCSSTTISTVKRGVKFYGWDPSSCTQVLQKQRAIESAIRSNPSVTAARRILPRVKRGPVKVVMGRMTNPRFKCLKAIAALTGKVVVLTRTGANSATLVVTSVPIRHVPLEWVRIEDGGSHGLRFINPLVNKHKHNVRIKRPAPEKRQANSVG